MALSKLLISAILLSLVVFGVYKLVVDNNVDKALKTQLNENCFSNKLSHAMTKPLNNLFPNGFLLASDILQNS